MPPTTLNNIIATASFIIPYPKTIENNLGYLLGLIIVRAATESDAQMVALYFTIRAVDKSIFSSKLFHLLINSNLFHNIPK